MHLRVEAKSNDEIAVGPAITGQIFVEILP
jgi:hypothetical protein